jgi:uncharacterized membrane protein
MTAKLLSLAFNIVLAAFLISSIEKNSVRNAWLLFLVLLAGDILLVVFLRRRFRAHPAELSSAEKILIATQRPTINELNYILAAGCLAVVVVGLVLLSWKIVLLGLLGVASAAARVFVSRHIKNRFERQG